MISSFYRNTLGALVAHFNLAPKDANKAMKAGCLISRGYSEEEAGQIVNRGRSFFGMRNNPIVPNVTDIQPWMYYDRLTAAASSSPSTSLLFFTTSLSATKTKLDTNLKQSGRLPDPKHFLVTSLRFVFDNGMSPSDINLLNKSYYIEFEIGDKIFAEGHFDLYPGGAGLDGFASAATTAAATSMQQLAVNNGFPSPMSINNWGKEHGIHILQGQSFVVRALAPVAVTLGAALVPVAQSTPGMNVRAVLDGILYREAQ